MLAVVYRPWILSIKVVDETLLEYGRGGLSGERNVEELLLELAVLVALAHEGRVVSVSSCVQACVTRAVAPVTELCTAV